MTRLSDMENINPYRSIPEELQQKINAQFNAVYGGF